MTGRTIATSRFLERLGRLATLSVIDLSGGVAASRGGRWAKAVRSVIWIMRLAFGASRRFDHVYLVANHGAGLWFDIAFVAMARLWGTPVIVHHHVFSYFNRRRRRVALLFRLTGCRSRHLLLCEGMRSACQALYPSSAQLRVQPNFGSGAPRQRIERPLAHGRTPVEIVFLSNLTREKGVGDVLALARRFAARGDVVFRVAGPAMNDEIRRAIEDCQRDCPETFEWLGPVDGERRNRLLAGADLFLFPTRYPNEAQPLVLIEALEAGVPVLANARGCITEMIGRDSEMLVSDETRFVEAASRVINRMLAVGGYRNELLALAPQHAAALADGATQALERFAAEL